MRLSLRRRIRLAAALAGGAAALVIGLGALDLQRGLHHHQTSNGLFALERDLALLSVLTHEYLLRGQTRPLGQWRALHAASLQRVSASGSTPRAARLAQDLERLGELFEHLVVETGSPAPLPPSRRAVFDQLLRLAGQLATDAYVLQRELDRQRTAEMWRAALARLGVLLASAVLIGVLLFRLLRNVTDSIEHLRTATLAVAGGARDVELTLARDDELGDLASHFAHMLGALRRSEALHEAAVRSMSDGLVVVDEEGTIRQVNPAVLRSFGYSAQELSGQHVGRLVRAAERAGLRQCLRALNDSGDGGDGRVEAELEAQRKDGSCFPVELSLGQSWVGGERYFTGVLRDVSLRRRAERELEAARARLDLAIESVADGFALFDAEDELVLCNSRYRRIYDKLADLLRPGVAFIDLLRAGLWRGQFAGVVKTEEWTLARLAARRQDTALIEQVLHDGRWIRIAEQRTPDGSRVAIETDITMLKQRELELRRSNEELERFAYAASHDLQEPLRKVRAFAERVAARYGAQLDERGHSYLQRTVEAAARMSALINDLLEYSRVSRQERPEEAVDLGSIARRALSDLEVRIEETGAQIDVGPLPVVYGDARQLQRVLQNLIGNALKFRRVGVDPWVSVTWHQAANEHRIEVRDNGIGFEPRFAEQIFEVFQRLHGHSEYSGSGIGLAIVRKIVERHGGRISAHGAPGEGARFVISLPRNDGGAHEAPARASALA